MSTKKQSHSLRPQPPATPRRAPSTPHAIRALLQRSGGRRRSANLNRPDSARNILRQLARIAAPQTKVRSSISPSKLSTPVEKESVDGPYAAQGDEDLENSDSLQKPDFTLPIDEIDEDDDVQMVPTRQELPGEEGYSFRSIDFPAQDGGAPTSVRSERGRRTSRVSLLPSLDERFSEDPEDRGDSTVQSVEYGRRAISEGPAWERFPRSSFGSIRMSEFAFEESRLEKEPQKEKSPIFGDYGVEPGAALNNDFELEGDTEELRQSRKSTSELVDDALFMQDPGPLDDDSTFRLGLNRGELAAEISDPPFTAQEGGDSEDMVNAMLSEPLQSSNSAASSRSASARPTSKAEATTPGRGHRRKKLRLTCKGNTVPTLPSSVVKRVAMDSITRPGKRRPTITRDSLVALEQATEWFFEQVGEDLEAYSDHAKRKKRIDEADVVTLMKRQRAIGRGQSLRDLAEELLPDEAFLELHLPEGA